jgi:pimeloyl-ACP methyl ester carboxylesterase
VGVSETPEVQYARTADGTNLAHQVSGDGPIDLVFCHWAPPIDLLSDDPGFVRVRRRPGTFSRILWFDPKGMGASEGDNRGTRAGDTYDGDLTALLDAVGFERPALVGNGQSGPAAIHFAVTHPERVSALVLVNSYAHYLRGDDYPWGLSRQDLDRGVTILRENPAGNLDFLAPSRVADERFRAWFARSYRLRGGPDKVADFVRPSFEDDVRHLVVITIYYTTPRGYTPLGGHPQDRLQGPSSGRIRRPDLKDGPRSGDPHSRPRRCPQARVP